MLQEGGTRNGIVVSHIKEFLAKAYLILVIIGFVDELSSCSWCNTNFDANCFTRLLPLVIIPSTFLATTTSGGDDSHLCSFSWELLWIITCAFVATILGSMTTIVVMGGRFLLFFRPCYCVCSTSSRFIFSKKGSGRGVGSWRKVIAKAMMLLLNLSLM